jgi:hypothetical protein
MNTKTTLPNEIFVEIFLRSLSHPLNHEGRLTFQTIRSVCSMWRMISISSPVLWSSISTAYDNIRALTGDELISLLRGWFSRAGSTTPLDLCLSFSPAVSEYKPAFLAFIGHFQPRWRTLDLSSMYLWESLLSLPSTNWSSLQVLDLTTTTFEFLSPAQHTERLEVLANIKSLKRIDLFAQDRGNTPERPFGPITLYELRIMFDDESELLFGDFNAEDGIEFTGYHMSLMSGYTSLTRLEFGGENFLSSRMPINHLNLPSLLYFTYHGRDLSLLQHFTTPVLATLDIRLDLRRKSEDLKPVDLSGFLARCTDTMKSIVLETSFNSRVLSIILPVLSRRPSITHINAQAWSLSQDWLRGIDESAWCPNLQTLTIVVHPQGHGRVEEMKPLATFLKRRWEMGGRELEMLTIRKRVKTSQVPYHFFKGVGVRKLRVTKPWDRCCRRGCRLKGYHEL